MNSVAWHQALQEAAEWYVCLHDDEVSPQDRQAWDGWLRGHALHRAAWDQVNATGQRFAGLRAQEAPQAMAAGLRAAAAPAPARRRALRTLACMAVAGASGWLAWRHTPLGDQVLAWNADYRTGVGEIRHLRLPDGSQLWLDTGSAADFAMDAAQRRLTLRQGTVLIETAHDSERPFVVCTPQGLMQALGTRFLVRRDAGQQIHLAVFDGAVEIRLAANGERRVVPRGAQADFQYDRIGPNAAADGAQATWQAGMLTVDNVRLADFLAQLSRYRRGHLAAHPDVADLRVMGTFPVPDTDAALAMLGEALPIRVQRTLPWWVTVEPR
ncbi:FecR domain-containing protein [Achromobacter pestifer]|uniref:Protein FecR n=1 Tax=Achromobacter pestifer TaxID=1353889 RepID=A0A6S7A6P0_9BURK|nr:FecR domain-containing protein [Achromobacter pestifer]CAB3709673.1 Protein FecR [Achromobacter pestifer]